MKTNRLTGLGVLCVVALCAVPATAGWFDRVVKPVAFEEIPAPAAVNVQVDGGGTSVLVQPAPAPQVAPAPHVVHHPQEQISHAPVVVPAPVHHHAHVCCKQPKVTYRNHPVLAMLMHKCKTGQAAKIVLEVPTGCCPAEVAVCVPICCTTCPPKLNERKDLLGRCVYEFCWPCGTKIKIIKRRTGDLVVHSYEL